LVLGGRKEHEAGVNCIVRNFIVCSVNQILLWG